MHLVFPLYQCNDWKSKTVSHVKYRNCNKLVKKLIKETTHFVPENMQCFLKIHSIYFHLSVQFPCVTLFLQFEVVSFTTNLSSWKTTPGRLSTTTISIYLNLISYLEAYSPIRSPRGRSCRRDGNPRMDIYTQTHIWMSITNFPCVSKYSTSQNV